MPADFLSINIIDANGNFSDNWKLEQDGFCKFIKKYMHTDKNNCSCKHLEIANSRFTDGGILWKK